MRILLIVYDNDSYIHWFPQGLAYIAAVLRQRGDRVQIYNQDLYHYSEEHLTDYLNQEHFDAVGVSISGGYYQYRKLLRISGAINKARQRPFYIIGGHGPASDPNYFLRKTKADAVAIGEGEATAVELMDHLAGGCQLKDISGIAYRQGDEVTVNPRRRLIEDIDSLPFPAYDLFPTLYYRLLRMPHASNNDFVMPMLSSRGCPFQCTFCYRLDEGFRLRSAQAIIDEIRYLKANYGITYIAFSDELLMSSAERAISLSEAFIRAELNIKWDCNGRLNYARQEVLRTMKRAGCVFINYGIEAMDDEVLRSMKKGLTVDIINKGIEATLEAGISPGLNIIFGNIGDNLQTLEKGVKFLLKYDDGAQMRTIRPVTPYPGTELFQTAVKLGLVKDCQDFYENKHVNSDLVSINFTEMTDRDFHKALYEANARLISNFFKKKQLGVISQAEELYLRGNTEFRGFRQT